MNVSLSFIRIFFLSLCILLFAAYTTTLSEGVTLTKLIIGVASGIVVGAIFIGCDTLFKRFNLRAFNIVLLGLFFGYLMGETVWTLLNTLLEFARLPIVPETASLVKMVLFLFTIYVSMVMTARASEELHLCIPFIQFKQNNHKKKDILVDASILSDSRIVDLANSGLLDHQLILPRFILNEFYTMAEHGDETAKSKAKRSLDVFKKLENIPNLHLRFDDTDFPEFKDSLSKLVRLARLIDCDIISADINRVQQTTIDGIRIINIHMLSNALKLITQTGGYINIKIQRYGKEARQGVGYLEDGTMVVVNGGAEYIGETIKAQVLSVKHTSSGCMIFCNATDETLLTEQEAAQSFAELEQHTNKSFFNFEKTFEKSFEKDLVKNQP